jgi:hypothetical protein
MSNQKIDLELLKRFVSELEGTLASADKIKLDKSAEKHAYTLEMSRAMGLIAGMMSECGLLMGDLQTLVSQSGSPLINKEDLLSKLFGKGPTNSN